MRRPADFLISLLIMQTRCSIKNIEAILEFTSYGIIVVNEDGLIVISDMTTGFWTFRMGGFNGWNGEDWGMPDISSVQKWDEESREGTK